MKPFPPMKSLRSFVAVARTCSVSRAAEELCVSPSAVSHQVHKLEEWLGLPLVERVGRGIRLTEAGERYKAKVCEAFDSIQRETELLRKHKGAPLVHVSSVPQFAMCWLVPHIHDFWARHPDVQLAIRYSRWSIAVDPDTIDVAIRSGKPDKFPNFLATPILEGAIFPFASPEYLQRMGYKELSDLSRLALLHDGQRKSWREWLKRATTRHELDASLAQRGTVYPDGHLSLGACLAGDGVALLARDVVLNQLRAKTLVQLCDVSILDDEPYLVLTPQSRPLSHGALVFTQWLRSAVSAGGCRVPPVMFPKPSHAVPRLL